MSSDAIRAAIWAAASRLETLELQIDQARADLIEAIKAAREADIPLVEIAGAAQLSVIEILAAAGTSIARQRNARTLGQSAESPSVTT